MVSFSSKFMVQDDMVPYVLNFLTFDKTVSHWHSLAVSITALYTKELLRYRLHSKVKIGLYLKSQHFCPRSKSSVCIKTLLVSKVLKSF